MEVTGKAYDLCGVIIGIAMRVHSSLGPGFLESVYKNALALELRRVDCKFEKEKSVNVFYSDEVVGSFVADLLVGGKVIVEVKAISVLAKAHEVQLVNYLTATKLNEGLLLNFGAQRLEFKKKFRLPPSEPVSF